MKGFSPNGTAGKFQRRFCVVDSGIRVTPDPDVLYDKGVLNAAVKRWDGTRRRKSGSIRYLPRMRTENGGKNNTHCRTII